MPVQSGLHLGSGDAISECLRRYACPVSNSGAAPGAALSVVDAQEGSAGAVLPVQPHRWPRRVAIWLGNHPRFLTRLAALCFFLAALTLTLMSSFTPYLQTCTDQIARVGNMPTVHTCGPMSIDAPPILILIIAAGVCLLPEWNVFEIPGLFRVERKVEEQARRQEEMLRILQQVQQNQSQSLTLLIDNSISGGLQDRTNAFLGRRPDQPESDQQ